MKRAPWVPRILDKILKETLGELSRMVRFLTSRSNAFSVSAVVLMGAFFLLAAGNAVSNNHPYSYHPDTCVFDYQLWKMSVESPLYGITYSDSPHLMKPQHISPILWAILPLYSIFQYPLTLLLFQGLMLSLGAIPVYLIAVHVLKKQVAGVVFSSAYLLHPATMMLGMNGYYSEIVAVPFILFALYLIEKEDYLKSVPFIALSLLCKETISFVVIFLGIYIIARKGERVFGFSIFSFGLFWAFLSMAVLFPVAYGTGYLENWGYLYSDEYSSDYSALANSDPLNSLFDDTDLKIRYLVFLSSPLAFLSFFSPLSLLPALPQLSLNLTGSQWQYSVNNHYSAVLLPFLIFSAIKGSSFVSSRSRRGYSIFVIMALVVSSLSVSLLFSPVDIVAFSGIRDDEKFSIMSGIGENSTVVSNLIACPHVTHYERFILLNETEEFTEMSGPVYILLVGNKSLPLDQSVNFVLARSQGNMNLYKRLSFPS